jgi:[acyl-carrier-protein] S-malonyltransferase
MPSQLQRNIERTAFAFRGYNVSNLGRTPELLAHPAYEPTIKKYLESASQLCSEVTGRPADLVRRVRERDEPTLAEYGEALALVMASELAQVQLLAEFHETHYAEAKLAYGYSLGELTAITCGGVFTMEQVLRVPLAMANDAAEMAANVTMGILFSRGPALVENDVVRLVRQITAEGQGTIGISAILSPNSYLLMGQDDTLERFKDVMHERLPGPAHLRVNSNRWPPLHTPIVRQKHITDRASVMMEQLEGGFQPPCPPVISMVTGRRSYDDFHSRDVIRQWIDGPQRLWDAVCETLASGVTTVVHVGPEPNVIPATFHRLSDNIAQQTAGNSLGSLGMRAAAGLARRPWLSAVLPSQVALLRAPLVQHVILEDWLLAHAPK